MVFSFSVSILMMFLLLFSNSYPTVSLEHTCNKKFSHNLVGDRSHIMSEFDRIVLNTFFQSFNGIFF